MSDSNEQDLTLYRVVVNDEGQYSIWPVDRPAPAGWNDGGKQGEKQECLAFIKEVWTDMRPRSLREAMAAAE
ncbi:MAG TPA: MbtH family protein [Polyangiaceae bacterium]|nr:MbtH family protein [Polyangiaceae bacterium]